MVQRTVTLISEQEYGSKPPAEATGKVLNSLVIATRHSTLMAVQGRSTTGGRRPSWQLPASDIRILDIAGETETVLVFEIPSLIEAAPKLYSQGELWPTRPSPESTGLDFLKNTIIDVHKGVKNSDNFDLALLRRLAGFKAIIDGTFQELSIDRVTSKKEERGTINENTIDKARKLSADTPNPRMTRIVGLLDMLRISTQSFELKLTDGQTVRGNMAENEISHFQEFLNREVLIEGQAIYRPSGNLLRIDASSISHGEDAPSIWSRIPAPITESLDRHSLRVPQTRKSGIGAFYGTWPGDETDEELLAALKEID